jgi:hypothetical protein
MVNYKKSYYELNQFLGCYFHQDWKEVMDWQGKTPNFEAIVRFYKLTNPQLTVRQTIEELQGILSLKLSDKKLSEILERDFGVAFNPSYVSLTDRRWLESILKILEDSDTSSNLSFIEQPDWKGWEDYVEGEIPSLESK